MNRTILLPTLALALAACVDNRTSVELTGRASPSTAATPTSGCEYTAGGKMFLGPGTLDVSYDGSYGIAVYAKNNLEDPKSIAPEAITDTKAWRPAAAKVRVNPKEYTDRFGSSDLLPVTSATFPDSTAGVGGDYIPPGGAGTEIFEVVSNTVVRKTAAAMALAGVSSGRVVLGITLQGYTLDGANLDTGEWYFPLEVCNGCLAPGAGVDLSVNPPVCRDAQGAIDTTKAVQSNTCFGLGQDVAPTCVPVATTTTP
jgi:hypothetical protein